MIDYYFNVVKIWLYNVIFTQLMCKVNSLCCSSTDKYYKLALRREHVTFGERFNKNSLLSEIEAAEVMTEWHPIINNPKHKKKILKLK